jgi:hypothetical protein
MSRKTPATQALQLRVCRPGEARDGPINCNEVEPKLATAAFRP